MAQILADIGQGSTNRDVVLGHVTDENIPSVILEGIELLHILMELVQICLCQIWRYKAANDDILIIYQMYAVYYGCEILKICIELLNRSLIL